MDTTDATSQALVIGGSLSGLLAARVLADHWPQVTIVERDELPDGPLPRKGLPQARHAHVLLSRGARILERLFPGLEAEALALGAPPICWSLDSATLLAGGWMPRFDSDLRSFSASRDLLEWLVRKRIQAIPGVSFVTDRAVTGLTTNGDRTQVTGVSVRRGTEAAEEIAADLVVDASGRTSRLPTWLADLGYGQTEVTTVNAGLGYATRWYAIPDGWEADWKLVLIAARYPDNPRGAVVLPVEGGRWVVTLAGTGGVLPSTDEAGFLAFAQSLAGPQIYDAICQAEAISPISGYARTENQWRHYEKMAHWPGGLIALGDAVCAFNPVYGQGMSVGALAAELLDSTIRRSGLDALGRVFQKKLAKALLTPWQLATGDDFRWAGRAAGEASLADRLMHRYLARVFANFDQTDVIHTFFSVTHLLAPPTALFRPSILWRALKAKPVDTK